MVDRIQDFISCVRKLTAGYNRDYITRVYQIHVAMYDVCNFFETLNLSILTESHDPLQFLANFRF